MTAALDRAGRAHLVAIAALPHVGPALVLACWRGGDPVGVWHAIVEGRPGKRIELQPDPHDAETLRGPVARHGAELAAAARQIDPIELLEQHERAGQQVLVPEDDHYPDRLRSDPAPPALLFAQGSLCSLAAPTVAVVGTRNATATGRATAAELAAELARRGVAVVSGLALGIDGAAHRAVVAAHLEPDRAREMGAPVGVVATGLDRAYPRHHADLHRQVAELGLLLTEAPLGAAPLRWRFPARNRIIAGLADAVLVVESHERGGALSTAEEALDRNRPVLAVPGSVHAEASAGTNRLIQEGSGLARSVLDVLEALPLGARPAAGRGGKVDPRRPERCAPRGYQPSAEEQTLLDALGWDPATLDVLVARLGWPLGITCRVVESLTTHNLVMHRGPHILQVRE